MTEPFPAPVAPATSRWVPCSRTSHGDPSSRRPMARALRSVCSGMKPDQAGASGTVTITQSDFSASITSQGATTDYSGTYTTSDPDGIKSLMITLSTGNLPSLVSQ